MQTWLFAILSKHRYLTMNVFTNLPLEEECPFDPFADELRHGLLTVFWDHKDTLLAPNSTCKLEVEGRLGCILDTSDSGFRVRLPIETEALLAYDFAHSFQSGIRQEQFEALKKHFYQFSGGASAGNTDNTLLASDLGTNIEETNLLGTPLDDEENDDAHTKPKPHMIAEWSLPLPANTLSEYYRVSDEKSVRCSYLLGSSRTDEPIEAIYKERLRQYQIYSGRDMNQGDEEEHRRQLVDLRVSINIEHTESAQTVKGLSSVHKRYRYRESFLHKSQLLRVDTTAVKNAVGQKANLFEVEVEINPAFLMHLLQSASASTHLFQICTLFMGVLRDMSGYLNGRQNLRYTDGTHNGLEHNSHSALFRNLDSMRSKEEIDAYFKYISKKPPLVGDYLYRAVAPLSQMKEQIEGQKDAYFAENGAPSNRRVKATNPYIYKKMEFGGALFYDPTTKTVVEIPLNK